MADKQLTESAWKAFAKGKNLKDSAFAKALSEYEKSEKGPGHGQLEALDELEKQAAALEKAYKADKALAGYIGDLEKALGKARKDAERKAEAEQAAADEEENEPALLTSKMVPLLRMVKKGEVMQAAVAIASKQTAVMLARRTISPARRKLLAEYMGSPGGVKYHVGQCSQAEGGAVLFAMETGGGGGMAKRLRQALLDQTGLRVKVKVRAADTGEEEEDDEAEAGAPASANAGLSQEAVNLVKGLYEERWKAIEPRLNETLSEQPVDGGKLRAVSAFAVEKAESGDYNAALKALDQLEQLLQEEDRSVGDKPAAGPKTFKERAAAVAARVKQAEAAKLAEAPKCKSMLTSAIGAASRGEPDTASTLLDEIEAMLDKAMGSGTAGVEQAALWDARIDEAERMLQRLQKSNPGEGEKAAKVMALARDRAAAGEHAKALAALEQMKKMVAAADAKPPPSGERGHPGLVKYRGSLLEFNKARSLVKTQLANLRLAIPAQMPDEADLADKLAEKLDELAEAMQDAVDQAINEAAKNPADPVPQEVADRIAEFEAELASSKLVKHVDGNPFGIAISIGQTLGNALKAVRDNMPTPA